MLTLLRHFQGTTQLLSL